MSTDAEQFLMGGGAPSAKFKSIGDTVNGRITEDPVVSQQTDFDSGAPKVWDTDGKPMMQLIVTLATELRSPDITDDDGTRRLYIKGKMQGAVRDAVKAASAKGLEVGGHLTVTYTGDDEPKRRGMSGAKLYRAEYVSAAASFVTGNDEPAATPGGAATQAAAAHVASAPNGDEPPAHLDASVKAAWANLPDATKAALRAQAS